MAESAYDCIVIGSGPGGYVAAVRAAQVGMKTAVIEKEHVGGRCLNVACIPAKAVLRVADILSEVEEAGEFGIDIDGHSVDYAKVAERRKKVISTLTGGVAGLLKKNKIDLIEGFGKLTEDGGVEVDGTPYTASRCVILATGSVKRPIPGTEFGGRVIGTEEGWALDELPATMAVVGAGASGAEMASAYARLGTKVQLFEALDRVLPTEDADISKVAGRALSKQGMEIHTSTLVTDVVPGDSGVTFKFGDTDGEAEYLVIAAGRGPDVEGLGLEAAGVKLDDRGLIEVDGRLRTSVDRIYAIGDLVPGPALAHKASKEGLVAAAVIAGDKGAKYDAKALPWAVFTEPEIATLGLTEQQAREKGYEPRVGKFPYAALGRAKSTNATEGFVKIVADKKYDEVLGVHMIGPRSTELVAEAVLALRLECTVEELIKTIHAHPTFSEAVGEAAHATHGAAIHM